MVNKVDQADMKAMFVDKELAAVNYQKKKAETLSPLKKNLLEMKNIVQILFRFAQHSKGARVRDSEKNPIALFIFHGIYSYPAMDSLHSDTPMIDASVYVFEKGETEFPELDNVAFGKDGLSELVIQRDEVSAFKKLLQFFKVSAMASSSLSFNVPIQLNFSKAIIYPIYSVVTIEKEGAGQARLGHAIRRDMRQMSEQVMNNPMALMQMMAMMQGMMN
jgi:hypothetical protein